MRWRLVTKLLTSGYFLDRHYLTAGTLNVQLHSSEGLNTLNVKCFRRRVWETRHSGATGWELLSLFSDVWCSLLLQLTMGSNWQLESLFRCQVWPHWMYVPDNIIRKENKWRLIWFHTIFTCARNYITSTIQYNSRHQPLWGTQPGPRNKFPISGSAKVTTVKTLFTLVIDTKNNTTICLHLSYVINLPKHCTAVQLMTVQFMPREIFECEQSGQGLGNAWWLHCYRIKTHCPYLL